MTTNQVEEVVTVGEAARILEKCVQTIRDWERSGVLRPVHRTSAGWRLYRRADVQRIANERAARAR